MRLGRCAHACSACRCCARAHDRRDRSCRGSGSSRSPTSRSSWSRTFADQAVIAIENARLLNELRERTDELARSVEELKALSEVGQAVSSTLDFGAVLSTILDRSVTLAGSDAGAIFRYSRAARVLPACRGGRLDAGDGRAMCASSTSRENVDRARRRDRQPRAAADPGFARAAAAIRCATSNRRRLSLRADRAAGRRRPHLRRDRAAAPRRRRIPGSDGAADADARLAIGAGDPERAAVPARSPRRASSSPRPAGTNRNSSPI